MIIMLWIICANLLIATVFLTLSAMNLRYVGRIRAGKKPDRIDRIAMAINSIGA